MAQLAFQYPTWFLLLCVVAGLVFAGGLYYRDNTFAFASQRTAKWLKALAVLRFLAVTILCFLLLAPFLRTRTTTAEEPAILLLADASESMRTALDSSGRQQLLDRLNALQAQLEEKFPVAAYHFSDALQPGMPDSFGGKVTDMGNAFQGLYDRYVNQNIGAVVLISDGVYNQGNHPAYGAQQIGAPVYTLAMGDTTQPRDIIIQSVDHNKIAYLDDQLEVRIQLSGYQVGGTKARLTIAYLPASGEAVPLHQSLINWEGNSAFVEKSILIPMDSVGVHQYRVSVSPVAGEQTVANNAQRFFVEVLDSRQQILILAHAPHPDITALRAAMKKNNNYEVTVHYTRQGAVSPEAFDLAILHQVPSAASDQGLVAPFIEAKTPLWFIVGPATDIATLNRTQQMVAINARGNWNEVTPILNQPFTLFKLPENMVEMIAQYPPIAAPYGEFQTAANTVVLLQQQIGAVKTAYPLLVFQQSTDSRQAMMLATGIWKWRLHHYLRFRQHQRFDDWIQQMVQFLSVQTDKRKFRVDLPKRTFNENEPVMLEAELYNASYELVNSPDVQLTILDQAGKAYPFTFSKSGNAYKLDAGYFPVGTYTYTATTTYSGEEYTATGQFSVQPVNLEMLQTTANHTLLYQLSEATGGTLFYPQNLEALGQAIMNREDIKPVLHDTFQTQVIINLKWIFFIIVGLLAIEWFIRRFNGAY